MSAKPFYPQYCSKCMLPIVVSWPPTEHKCEPPQDLSWALPPDTIQIPLAEYEKLKADAERLKQALENVQSEIRSVAGTLMDSVFSHQTQGGWLHQEALVLERCLIAIDAAIKQEGGA
jgi:hypothetical protein